MIKKSVLVVLILVSIWISVSQTNGSAQTTSPATAIPYNQTVVYNNHLPLIFNWQGTQSPAPTPTPPPRTTPPPLPITGDGNWSMVGANPQRTSWTPETVDGEVFVGSIDVEWYRPIEAYISQDVQIIASNGLLYISTARGLYALYASNGEVAWRFDTELPLGNSPTVVDGVVYVGGYDRKIHALNAINGSHLWSFEGALAGFSTNPLVVDGKVFAGNRDGYMYAIGAHGTPVQGQLLWKFKTKGLIDLSAAYKDGVVYFAADDNFAYALNADTGSLVWKSKKLIGDGYHSYWPVIYTNPTDGQDYVIFSTASGYRTNAQPGTQSLLCPSYLPDDPSLVPCDGTRFNNADLFFDRPEPDATLGPIVQINEPWAQDKTVVDYSRVTQFLEDNPNPHPHLHKPWRRFYIILNTNDGSEYTFDSDGDGHGEYVPIIPYGTNSGNYYPPIVGSDNFLYFNNFYQKLDQGRIMGWRMGTPYLILGKGQGADAEPQAISSGGSLVYRSICCDRLGDWFDITNTSNNGNLWHYILDLNDLAPGYDDMWTVLPGLPRLYGWYKGNTESVNGIYHNHGDQNPIIPYGGRLFVHRSNAIIAFGKEQGPGRLPMLPVNDIQDTGQTLTSQNLRDLLENEVQKIIDAGHLRPGYYNTGQSDPRLADYFDNPGDTLITLTQAFPYLSPQLQEQTRAYLRNEFQTYFDPAMYATIGWADGAARESMPLPPEVEQDLPNHPPRAAASSIWSWQYPPHNFYAMWKYAQIFQGETNRVYELAKSKIEVPVQVTTDYFVQKPYELNAYITGYIGFLELQELAGMNSQDSQLRSTVSDELNRLLQLRTSIFTKDTYWIDEKPHNKHLNIARNFMMLSPELGEYLGQNILGKVQEAIDEYDYIAPYWFVSRYESVVDEGVMSILYNYNAIFQAKAYILEESQAELIKYLDAPAFEIGDLFYIQNLIAAIEANQ